jgi:cysteine synthase
VRTLLDSLNVTKGASASNDSVLNSIGNTPLQKLNVGFRGQTYRIFGKLEFVNPSGSIKDRIAKYMIEQAERRGQLGPGSVIVEATSGNTGIALSMVAAAKVYNMLVVMPEHIDRKSVV